MTRDPRPTPERLESLPEIEAALWRELARATHDRHHEWRHAVLATVDKGLPQARTIVLREVDADARRLVFFSDSRAGKVAQAQAQPLALLVVWSKRLGWQLRLRLHLDIQLDGLAVSSRWARLRMSPAAQDYLSPLPPGAPIEHPAPAEAALAAREDRAHFAVIEARVIEVDWLELHPAGHRRAGFERGGVARWLQA